jgi:predicted TIM-barrel fold metal-dependent hydrolase
MTKGPSRRTVLKSVGGALAAGVLGAGAWTVYRFTAGRGNAGVKPIIDTHIHLVHPNLPGVPEIRAQDGTSFDGPLDELAESIRIEMRAVGVEHALCMPRREVSEEDPLGIERTRRLAALVPALHPIGLADPERTDEAHLARVEEALKRGQVVALKAYLGYLHHGPDSPGYRPYYELAARYRIPVIFHTGDNYSHRAKVKYAQPLLVDEVAVDFPQTRFVIAHMGYPWLMDAAEVIHKNNKKGVKENVWADLSGILVGSASDFEAYRARGLLKAVTEEVRKALYYTERPDRILYGSDWPLAPMAAYRDFILELIPVEYHQAVFHDNAKSLFRL